MLYSFVAWYDTLLDLSTRWHIHLERVVIVGKRARIDHGALAMRVRVGLLLVGDHNQIGQRVHAHDMVIVPVDGHNMQWQRRQVRLANDGLGELDQ